MIGLIGGYGLEKLLENPKEEKHEARFADEKEGLVVFQTFTGKVGGKEVVIIPRHGVNHNLSPHKVPYKSMIKLLRDKGVNKILTINSVGIMSEDMKKNSFILLKDFVNFGKEITFFDSFKDGAKHTNMSKPYDKKMNDVLAAVLKAKSVRFYTDRIYVNSHGPRFETPAEIDRKYRPCGDVIGMTGAYEAILANEVGLPIAVLCLGANYAEGCGEQADFEEMKKIVSEMKERLFSVLKEAIPKL